MAAETGFLIDGTIYEVPTIDSMTVGERRVMFEMSGATQEDFFRREDETEDEHEERVGKMMRHAGFWPALMTIAYQRGNPSVKATKVSLVIDQTNFLNATATLTDEDDDEDEGDDAGPLALTPPPDKPSPRKPSSRRASTKHSRESGGSDSTTDSDEPASDPIPIGTTRSGTSSQVSDQTESVA